MSRREIRHFVGLEEFVARGRAAQAAVDEQLCHVGSQNWKSKQKDVHMPKKAAKKPTAKRPRQRAVLFTEPKPPRPTRRLDARERQMPTGDRDDDAVDYDTHDGQPPLLNPGINDDLGPITLPSPQDAHRVLRELASLYHERHEAAQRHASLHSRTKDAAKVLTELDARIAERIRVATHRTGLPLFADEERTGTLD